MLRLRLTSCTSHIHKSQSCQSQEVDLGLASCVRVLFCMTIVAHIKYLNVFIYISHLL